MSVFGQLKFTITRNHDEPLISTVLEQLKIKMVSPDGLSVYIADIKRERNSNIRLFGELSRFILEHIADCHADCFASVRIYIPFDQRVEAIEVLGWEV